ncbi:hypothetical protein [Rhizobium sp. HT1-10]|uniref:hypothetical protein n=1 Tax=Rhizobium sp. HT1-10 TaxID=3111638 RepID=UPI003C284575
MTFSINSKMKTCAGPRPVLSGVKRAVMIAVSASVLSLLGASFAVAGSPARAENCAHIKDVVKTVGQDLYRYRDPQHPGLPLYTLYVRSDSQCNIGEALEPRAVASLDGCFIQTCVQDDNGNN